jgi:hypothetical protein
MRRARSAGPAAALAFAASTLAPGAAAGQELLDARQRLDFDRPEAWGMKFAAAVLTFSALDSLRALPPGAFEIAVEGVSVPSLSEHERRIGFVGTKVEDIDRTPAYGRVRARVGLPRGFDLAVGIVPPVELDGLEPRFLALSLGRVLRERPALRLGTRAHVQAGHLEGDMTCSRRQVAGGEDRQRNPLNCREASNDELELLLFGFDLVIARPARRPGGLEPYLTVGVQRLDGTFRVDALYGNLRDRAQLETEGTTFAVAAGLSGSVRDRWRFAGEAYYSPLEIRRPESGRTNEPVLNFRVLAALRWR